MLGQYGVNAVFRLRRRASVVRLQAPVVIVWQAFALGGPHDTVAVAGWADGYRLRLRAVGADARLGRDIAFRATWGWTYLLPFENTIGPQARRYTTEWLALVLFPTGYYGAAAVRPARARRPAASGVRAWRLLALLPVALVPVGIAAALLAGLVALPDAVGLPAPAAWEWAGAIAGIAAGGITGAVVLGVGRSRVPHPER
jgi:hypothetical protein